MNLEAAPEPGTLRNAASGELNRHAAIEFLIDDFENCGVS